MSNIADSLKVASGEYADHCAVEQPGGASWTFRELARRVEARANWLNTAGVKRGDRVILFMGNCPEFVEHFYAALWAGAVVVPVNAKLHAKELAVIVDDAQPILIITDRHHLAVAQDASEAATGGIEIQLSDQPAGTDAEGTGCTSPAEVSGDDLAWLFYTSGTTGAPKGAMLTHDNLRLMAMSYLEEVNGVCAGDSILHAAPMSHGSGMYMIPHLMAGSCQLIPPSGGFDEAEIVEICAGRQGIAMFAAPTMVHRLIDYCLGDNSSEASAALRQGIKCITYGGGPMLLDTARRARDLLGTRLTQIYGQGECPMTISRLQSDAFASPDSAETDRLMSSVGQPFKRVEVRISGAGNAGEIGEILASGPLLMKGYWQNEAATAAAISDGWLHTGDVGYFDPDGNLHLTDRVKDVIICGGSNIYSREVEDVLIAHPDVSEVAVIGRPSAEWGEEVVAFIVPHDDKLSQQDLDQHCLGALARFKRPREYYFVNSIEKNAYGKVDKKALRRVIEAR